MPQLNHIRRSALWSFITIGALLLFGALQARTAYETRGIPAGLPEPIAHGGVQLGVNVRLDQYDSAELVTTLDAIAATRAIRTVKQPFFYSTSFDWAAADRIIQATTERGLKLVPLLDGDPVNAFAPIPPADFSAWTSQFALRYADQIDHYFIWDEPNLASHWGGEKVNPDVYAALLSAAGDSIRASDPTATIVAAPLAPTTETDTVNMADWLYLQRLYEAEARFDVAAGKPYGFDTPPHDLRVNNEVLNFSRIILLREVMERNGDSGKAIWAGNWGWNALPDDWIGGKSVWGEVTFEKQIDYTQGAISRANAQWPWMGFMFIEHWEPLANADDPINGFALKERPVLQDSVRLQDSPPAAATGFHFAAADNPHMAWRGDWEFSPEFGADSSEKYVENGDTRDSMTFTFWGTDVGMRVRRADFRARFYVTVDGEPANARPRDEFGSTVVLDAPNPNEDYITIEPIATGLEPGIHTLEVVAHRGWDQFALNGFSVGYQPRSRLSPAAIGLLAVALLSGIMGLRSAYAVGVSNWLAWWDGWRLWFGRKSQRMQFLMLSAIASALSIGGLLTWLQNGVGVYRRLGEVQQLALTASVAAIFYVTPWLIVYLVALVALILLISMRPVWGIGLVAFAMPLYARQQILKPIFDVYLFSPTELFTLAAVAGVALHLFATRPPAYAPPASSIHRDWRIVAVDFGVVALFAIATASLFFTERLDVATNEWRTVMLGSLLFYGLLRVVKLTRAEWWIVLDCFVLGGLLVAVYGLAQVVFGFQDLITAEGGLRRVQSIYGSPNNVALYFGRILPFLIAIPVFGSSLSTRRRTLYAIAAIIVALTFLLTFSKGGILIGAPVAVFILFAFWLKGQNRPILPWLFAFIVALVVGFVALLQVPQLAARLDLFGQTSFLRYRLWQASVQMIRENPWFGVGLDNFLYAHRGRYILESAWREPNLNHPHNFVLDFGTRLGLLGLAAWVWICVGFGRILRTLPRSPLAIGLIAAFGYVLAHGLVDHSFFLVDLAYSFMLLLGLAVQLRKWHTGQQPNATEAT